MPQPVRNLWVLAAAIGTPIIAHLLFQRFEVNQYTQDILFKIGLNITLAVGMSLIIGFAGQFTLGHAGFMSFGAFFSGLFTWHVIGAWTQGLDAGWLDGDSSGAIALRYGLLVVTLLIGMGAAAAASFIVGLPSLRLRGDYLAIATLGFGEIVYNLFLIVIQRNYYDTSFYIPTELGFMSKTVNVAAVWIVALLAILIVRNLVSSTSGRALPAIREDEIASGAVGIRCTRFKMLAFVIGSAFAGAAGVFEAHQSQTINPASFRFERSIELIVPVVLGGSGSLTGCVLASALFTYLLELLRSVPSGAQQFRTIFFAGVLVLVMVLRPQGLMGRYELRDLFTWLRGKRGRSAPVAGHADGGSIIHTDQPRPQSGVLECRDLTIRFGGLTAVHNFGLRLSPGEIVGLIGPNGAGKTTCFNMITGVYRPTGGEITLGGLSLVGRDCAAINHRGIARTFQNIRLFAELTALDNVRVARHAHLKTGVISAILRTPAFYRDEGHTFASARDLLHIFGLDPFADERARNLPYGVQRRLEMARALATKPAVLCLDEPAAGMNPAEKKALLELIRSIRNRFQVAILLIEHDMNVVMNVCERIVVLDHGETIAEGRPAEIRNHPKVIEAYLGESAA